jgi:hypothetical protein
MAHRIRFALKDPVFDDKLSGPVEELKKADGLIQRWQT